MSLSLQFVAQLLEDIFNPSLSASVRHSQLQIFTLVNHLSCCASLLCLPTISIITMYADYKNMKEAEKDVTSPRCWFLPTYYSQAALADWSGLNFAQAAGFRDRYMGRLDTCEKIYVPINCDGHWYMLLVDISHATATIWDSLESPSRREKMINESLAILASLDFVLRQEARALFGNRFSFFNFQICCQAGVPQQPNGFDCGYYVMKYMDNPSIVVHDSYQHDSDHARLLLALYLVQSPLNKIRRRLIQEARKL
ncbi:hypothetical protein WN944_008258 [Citrus x changshan-huyou]|uniref:Ubiquitin-like protease family profile domain-containing protein n=1 Tax=Citrus x changshan-huyou TaxID=2935761 RepID=A0AAP0MMK8_9ROSI